MSKDKNELMLAKDAIEFQPDAIELANRKLPWWAGQGVLWLFLLFVIAVVWASIGKVDTVVQCQGKVISRTNNITMAAVDRMVVEEVMVREGDTVKAGDPLFRFDPTINEADYTNITDQLNKLRPAYERLKCEFDGKPYVLTPEDEKDHNKLIQKRLYEQRQSTYKSRENYYNAAIATTKSQIETTMGNIETLERTIKEFTTIVERYRNLYKENVAAIVELSQVEMNLISYEGQLLQYRNQLPTQESQLNSNIAEKQAFIESWQQQVADEFNTAERDMNSAEQQMQKVIRYRDYYVINSPMDAVVHEVARYAKGSAVREAEALITLIPVNVNYMLEVQIPAKDIAKVRRKLNGQVKIKLTPYPFQSYGTLEGVLIDISEDTFNRSAQQQMTDMSSALTGNSYYRGYVSIIDTYNKPDSKFHLRAGMEAQADILVGDRRIISYIFHPLIKMLDESLREP